MYKLLNYYKITFVVNITYCRYVFNNIKLIQSFKFIKILLEIREILKLFFKIICEIFEII